MSDLLRKLTSRKLWLAVAGLVTGVAMAFGVDQSAVTTVAGAVTAVISVATYVLAEGRVDAASVQTAAEQIRGAAAAVQNGGETGDGDSAAS